MAAINSLKHVSSHCSTLYFSKIVDPPESVKDKRNAPPAFAGRQSGGEEFDFPEWKEQQEGEDSEGAGDFTFGQVPGGVSYLPEDQRADVNLFAYRGEAKKYHSMAAPDEKVLPYLAARHENPCPIRKKMATRKTPYREPSLKAENESAQGGIRVTG